ncbi:MAG: type IV pili methyl-accepting chemotaxis transducer N-terminal domain-containing protein, partial [Mycoplasmataceae bacterium]|nr:type IV pili methyl-accepting chemotaxis transducer N-terminal domain-containing protein [Mycoplasmataceae bacterium]
TLHVSRRLEGGVAAINDAGSERMRSYQIGFLLSQHIDHPSQALKLELEHVIFEFEQTLELLEKGDSSRPLILPKDIEIRSALEQIQLTWHQTNKRFVDDILRELDKKKAQLLLKKYSGELRTLVVNIDKLVLMVENSQAKSTRLLRTFQNGLVALAFIGTILLISLFTKMVITPVQRLKKGLDIMGQGDFSVRLPVTSQDELGDLAGGFNHMVKQLQELYATLEDRIRSKTNTLELKSRELAALYDTASFVNTAPATEVLCDVVLKKMMELFDAPAGVVRLVDPKGVGVPIVACAGLSEEFITQENKLQCGECLCGETVNTEKATSCNIAPHEEGSLLINHTCKNEGFHGVVSVPVKARQQVIGVFNLFFHQPRVLPRSEVKLLETVSQHLGSAIENQLFVDREKEMAISEERNLLAQELHDSIAQSLAFLNIQAQLLQDALRKGEAPRVDETLSQIREGIQESYDDVRELLVHFRTRIEHDDIDVAIRDALEKFEGQTGISTHYEFDGNAVTLQPEIILQFLHILHECLSNIRKHSQASNVEVQLSHGNECQLIIHDDGIGFDNTVEAGETHVGLRIMKERTHRINGNLTIDSSPDNGTTICLTLPVTTYISNEESSQTWVFVFY